VNKLEKGYEYDINYLKEPRTGINYRGTTDDFNTCEVGRTVELNYENDAIDDGLLHRAIPNYNSDDYINKYSKENVNGIYKLDKNNPIWQYNNEDIKMAVLRKLQQQYPIIKDIEGLDVKIDRNKGVIDYKYNMEIIKSNKKNIKCDDNNKEIGNEEDVNELDREETFFEKLRVGETFYIDPQKFQALYPAFYKNKQFDKIGKFTRGTKWKKTSSTTFCLFFGSNKCVEAYVAFAEISNNSVFQIYVDGLRNKYSEYYGYIKSQLGRDITMEDKFIKINNNQYKLYDKDSDKILKINQPMNLQVLFLVFVIEVDKEVASPQAIPLKDIPIGTIFTFTISAVKPIYHDKIKPGKTKFIKMTDDEVYLYKPEKFNQDLLTLEIDDPDWENFKTVEDIEKAQKLDEFKTMIKKKAERTREVPFMIIDNLLPEENDFGTRRISAGSYVFIIEEKEFIIKKKSTMDQLLGSLFGKYETKKDDKGEYIKISQRELEQQLASVGLTYTDFDKLSHKEDIDLPTGEYETKEDGTKIPIYKKFNTTLGNSENFYWVLTADGYWTINK
jgi:hypothetical protein